VKLQILRIAQTSKATLGVLTIDGMPRFVTLEPPWLDNKQNISAIPEGNYKIERVQSPRFGNTFEVKAVPNRSAILFHAGNRPEDTQGCILVGTRFGMTLEVPSILNSRDGMQWLMVFLQNRNNAELEIKKIV
jgi:hypothetical protein